MIHHLSIPAENPSHVANILAELWQGRVFPFPAYAGSYVVFASNNHLGICIEVIPMGSVMTPGVGREEMQSQANLSSRRFCETHVAISVPISPAEIEAIATREGWRSQVCDRGPGCFHVVEFWLENRLLLELLTPEMATEYTHFMTPENWQSFLTTIPTA